MKRSGHRSHDIKDADEAKAARTGPAPLHRDPFAEQEKNLPAASPAVSRDRAQRRPQGISREAQTETLVTVGTQTRQEPAQPTDMTRVLERQQPQKRDRRTAVLAILALILGVGVSYKLVDEIRLRDATEKAAHQRFLNERVEFHKRNTGTRLNIERMETEMANIRKAPPIAPEHLLSVPTRPDVMTGMPLNQEPPTIAARPDPSRPVFPGFADVNVRRKLEEEKQALALERAAERQHIMEREATIKAFIENARRAGYQVQVDENLDVTVKRGPGSVQSLEGESNAAR